MDTRDVARTLTCWRGILYSSTVLTASKRSISKMTSSPPNSPGRFGNMGAMGHRFITRWASWSNTSPGSPILSETVSLSPQPPRAFQARSRTTSKASNTSEITPNQYPLVPKLPVPPLGNTLNWYLTHLQTLLPPEKYEEAKKLVQHFGKPNGDGEKLQEELIKRHESMENWAYQWWLEEMYLKVPLCLPINSNPGMVFPHQKFTSTYDMANFAAKMCDAALEMMENIDKDEIDVDRCGGKEWKQPMCMAQYKRVFNCYRCPGMPKDKHMMCQHRDKAHIVVFYKCHMFKVDVVVNGQKNSLEQITWQLGEVLREVETWDGPDAPQVGILTSENRRTWAQARLILQAEPINKKNMEVLETCVMIICFDEALPDKFNLTTPLTNKRASLAKRSSSLQMQNQEPPSRDEVNAGHQMIHGGGSSNNTANRWFDKTIQLVFSRDGWCGLCYEHSPAEGIVVIQLVEQVLQASTISELDKNIVLEVDLDEGENGSVHSGSDSSVNQKGPPPVKLEWKVTPVLNRRIAEAADTIDRLVDDLDFRILRFTGFGRNYIKNSKCSPDAFIQMALQLAFFRTHGVLPSTYESASTRRFRLGRVDCIRSNTPLVLAWVETMVINAPVQARYAKFKEALALQTEIMGNNIQGRGIDIHLLGLKEASQEILMETPEFFTDSSFEIANHFRLSTSQVPTYTDSWMGYGPVVPDGYGASYNPHPDYIVFCLSAFNSCPDTSTLEFGRNVERALDELKAMFE
ncbi:unnamed protein product, partial [Meganyctiphanes norvegica]